MSLLRNWLAVGLAGGLVLTGGALAYAGDRYVVKGNPGAVPPYDSWATAAAAIQTAVDAASEGEPVWARASAQGTFLSKRSYRSVGDTVWVRAAVYDAGGTAAAGWQARLTNRVAITKAIVVRSEHNDPTTTIIKGVWSANGRTNGPDAVRCAYVADGAALIGFTLTGGATLTMNEAWANNSDRSGGGVYAPSSMAVISNCIITGNSAFGDHNGTARGGAGACGGKFHNCVFTSNTTPFSGGGADHSVMFDCVAAGNSAGGNGGGVNGSTLYGCAVSNNSAGASGGGAFGGRLSACTLVNNRAAGHGGGAASTDGSPPVVLSDCVVTFNYAGGSGGGVRMGQLFNCRVAGNRNAGGPNDVHQCEVSNRVSIGNDTVDRRAFHEGKPK